MASTQNGTMDTDSNRDTNFARITSLLMREGTDRMKHITLQYLPLRQTLAQALQVNEATFKYLRKRGIISEAQYDILYPFHGDMASIDMSLWMVLARNVTQKPCRRGQLWKNSPASHETNWQHDFIRLRETRNYLFHASTPELTEDRFNEIKRDLVSTLKRLGSDDVTVNALLTRDLDPQQTSMYRMQIKQQYMEEKWVENLQRKKHTKMLIIVLAVLSFLVATGIAIAIYWFTSRAVPCEKSIVRLHTTSGILNFMPRKGWGAHPTRDANTIPLLKKPVSMAVIHHSAMVQNDCSVTSDCCGVVRWLQQALMDGTLDQSRRDKDMPFNYLIGGDGVVYEGRGVHYQGAAVWGRNPEVISIAFMGNYACDVPSRTAFMALYTFLEYIQQDDPVNTVGTKTHHKSPILSQDYRLYGHCQVNLYTAKHKVKFPDSPGAATMGEIKFWHQWRNDNISECTTTKDCLASYNCCKAPCNSSTF